MQWRCPFCVFVCLSLECILPMVVRAYHVGHLGHSDLCCWWSCSWQWRIIDWDRNWMKSIVSGAYLTTIVSWTPLNSHSNSSIHSSICWKMPGETSILFNNSDTRTSGRSPVAWSPWKCWCFIQLSRPWKSSKWFQSPVTSSWPHLRCDVGLEEREYKWKLSLCYSIVYYYNDAQRYEQFLQVGGLYRALILLGLALCSSASVSSVLIVIYRY